MAYAAVLCAAHCTSSIVCCLCAVCCMLCAVGLCAMCCILHLSYVVEEKTMPGRFDPKVAFSRGLQPGPLFKCVPSFPSSLSLPSLFHLCFRAPNAEHREPCPEPLSPFSFPFLSLLVFLCPERGSPQNLVLKSSILLPFQSFLCLLWFPWKTNPVSIVSNPLLPFRSFPLCVWSFPWCRTRNPLSPVLSPSLPVAALSFPA